MTFDIDAAIAEKFQKAGGASLVYNSDNGTYDNPDDSSEYYDEVMEDTYKDPSLTYIPPFHSDFFDANASKSDPWKSRIGIPEDLDNYISKFVSDAIRNNKEYFRDNPIPEIIREATPDWGYDDSEFNLDDLLFYALRNGARTNLAGNRRDRMRYKPDPDGRAKEQAAKLQAKKAKKTEKINRSADINARMSQWSAAGRAQHTGETESILKAKVAANEAKEKE